MGVGMQMKQRALIVILFVIGFIVFAFAPAQVAAESSTRVKVGDKAPDFSLPDQDGRILSLQDFAGTKSVILYFYPKDNIGICKQEACLFRDQYRQFVDAGAEVLGVSSDSVKSHKNFVTQRNLPFKLLSDKHAKVRKLYGVPPAIKGMLSGRVTFVIDRQGTLRLSFNSMMHADRHVSEALKVLKEIDQTSERSKSGEEPVAADR
jgi:peroxiredoxin Q/BCP